jgi:hypothetical protein
MATAYERHSRYYEKNKELCKKRAKLWAKNNKKKVEQQRIDRVRNNPVAYLLCLAKARARKKGLEYNLTEADVVLPEVCPVLGISLTALRAGTGTQDPGTPTLDRIRSSEGYIKGNVAVISWRANSLKKDATLEELQRLVEWLSRFHGDSSRNGLG